MAELIKPLLTGKPFESTTHRINTFFQPIQKTRTKESDFIAFVATPVLDYFVLDAVFALDASIRILNATASLLKAAYLWSLNQQRTENFIDPETEKELDDVITNLVYIWSALSAQVLNILFSTVSLISRPIASIVEAAGCFAEEQSEFRPNFSN
ncbi:hypothetical protein [Legionella brunensis]|uniref:Uncharacterized protein n=1 Tax=Legionella brunensis TaxID=29422 RepID=A0A0W0S4T9_9GAMM|nr:hypothetical protein [Legionella brunensis]KTC78394.1 hypothetical protein Lbru_2686 [Legionella brunensis]